MGRRHLIFVPEINERTFVFFFHRGESGRSYSIRDYTRTPVQITRQHDYPYTAEEILGLANREGCYRVTAPTISTDETGFWLGQIEDLNRRHLGAGIGLVSARSPDDGGKPRPSPRSLVIRPDTPYGNRLALKELIGTATGVLRWYERHMPGSVLKLLYRHANFPSLQDIRLLSGRRSLGPDTKQELADFSREISGLHGARTQWRILSRSRASEHHDRVFMSESGAFNIPPINSWVKGQTSEVSGSSLGPDEFDLWWAEGRPLEAPDAGSHHTPARLEGA